MELQNTRESLEVAELQVTSLNQTLDEVEQSKSDLDQVREKMSYLCLKNSFSMQDQESKENIFNFSWLFTR